jgi:hypothetical protein
VTTLYHCTILFVVAVDVAVAVAVAVAVVIVKDEKKNEKLRTGISD